MSKPTRRVIQGMNQKVLVGVQQELSDIPTLYLAAMTFTPQTLAEYVQNRIRLANAVVETKAAWLDAIQAYEGTSKQAKRVVSDLRNVVIGIFGEASPTLATFGFQPDKRRVLTPEQKAAAALKAKATRKARRTMSKKQKATIVGTVDPPAAQTAPSKSSEPGSP